jgi:uncharacterized membrane protein YheB (UPF0754 family)
MNYWLLFIPLISAFVGWGVNTVLIQLIFYPLIPKKILGITIQGLIPKNQLVIANQAAKYVTSQISFQVIEEKLTNPDIIEKIMPFIEEEIDNFLRNKLPLQLPMISMFIGDKTIAQLNEVFIAELRILFPKLISNYIHTIQSNSTLEMIISQKIASIPLDSIENSIRIGLKKEFQLFRFIGIVTGFLIGLFQIMISLFIS